MSRYGDNLLDIEQEMHYITILRHIFLAFDIHLSGLAHGCLAAKRHIVVIFYDLGADKATVFLKTTLPLSVSGILSGVTMVFIPTISTYAISQLLSNGKIFLFGDSIQLSFEQGMYGVGSIMSIVMLIFVLLSNFIMNKFNRRGNAARRSLW